MDHSCNPWDAPQSYCKRESFLISMSTYCWLGWWINWWQCTTNRKKKKMRALKKSQKKLPRSCRLFKMQAKFLTTATSPDMALWVLSLQYNMSKPKAWALYLHRNIRNDKIQITSKHAKVSHINSFLLSTLLPAKSLILYESIHT